MERGICLNILWVKFDPITCSFAPDQEFLSELTKTEVVKEGNFKQIQTVCMPFLRFKKNEVKASGAQALNLRLQFGEVEVIAENSGLIRWQSGLEHLEVLAILRLLLEQGIMFLF